MLIGRKILVSLVRWLVWHWSAWHSILFLLGGGLKLWESFKMRLCLKQKLKFIDLHLLIAIIDFRKHLTYLFIKLKLNCANAALLFKVQIFVGLCREYNYIRLMVR